MKQPMQPLRLVLLLFFLGITGLMQAQTSAMPSGSGTSSDPYRIDSLPNLYWLSQESSYWGAYFIQTADIDASATSSWNSGSGFSPIGNTTTNFTGTYDGQMHTISGLTISRSTSEYIGLFGLTNGATIRQLGLVSCSIVGHMEVGALVGCLVGGSIHKCYSSGTVSGVNSSSDPACSIGGLAGQNYGGISYCYSKANVAGSQYVGGLTGWSENSATNNCYTSGTVSGTVFVGGLIGRGTSGSVCNYCYSISTASGLIGSSINGSSINHCFYNSTGETALELKVLSTFTNAGWDFAGETTNGTTDLWAISSNVNDGYPCFTWQGASSIQAITTDSISSISAGSAVAYGSLTNIGYPSTTAYGFCYSTSVDPTLANNVLSLGSASATRAFSDTLENLMPTTTYHLRAYALNAVDTVYGEQISFTTPSKSKPTVSAFTISTIAGTSAMLNGIVNANNDNTTVVFEYGTTNSFGSSITASQSPVTGTTATAVNVALTGLSTSTAYYARVKATNTLGTVYGDTICFSTLLTGSGTSVDPYEVTSVENLKWISENSSSWSKNFIQTADIDASGTSSWNSGSGFSPIGNTTTNFTGTYNGKGYTIAGLTISRSTTNDIGFFGYIASGATVDSLGLVSSTVTGQNYVGILAGWNIGTIQHCYTSGVLTGVLCVGGLAGQNDGGTIRYTHSSATVNCSNSNVGGLTGVNENGGTIGYCYATGNTNGGTATSSYSSGGLVGYNASTISNSYATGNVVGYNIVGGLVGAGSGTISNCYATGTVTGTADVGGLDGKSATVTNSFYNKEIYTGTTSYGTGKTTAELQTLSTFTDAGWDFTGETANGTTDNWAILSSINSGYPCFIWQRTPEAPVVTTDSVSDTKRTSVTIYGTITTVGCPNASYGVCYATTENPTTSNDQMDKGVASITGAFSTTITGLTADMTYYARAFATNSTGTVYGGQVTFKTLLFSKPEISTAAADSITNNSVKLSGTVNASNASTTVVFEYGTTTNFGSSITASQSPVTGTTTTTVSCTLTGIAASTTYYARVKATNSQGTVYGDTIRFSTLIGGSGTSVDPYEVTSVEDLKWISENSSSWSKNFIQTADIDASGTSSWNSGSGFSPIGNTTTKFTGTYNGQEHTITGLTISRSTTNYIGFFGCIANGATVDSLGLVSSTVTGQDNVGALVGYNSGTVQHSYTTGVVTGSYSVGGLVGQNNERGAMTYAYSSATVNGKYDVGGFAGDNSDGSTISYCYASGNTNGGTATSNYSTGGLVGYSESTISNSYATGNVVGYNLVGGLVGAGSGTISNCYATGSVTGTSNVGGLDGKSATVNNSFYNKEIYTGTTSYGMGKTTTELQALSTFTDAGWDFTGETANGTTDNWTILSSINSGYPCFIWQRTPEAPSITTDSVSDTKITSATVHGIITTMGIPKPSYGVCYATTENPTTSNNQIKNGTALTIGTFSTTITGLTPGTTYYARAFATNSTGTVYGGQVTFKTILSSKAEISTMTASNVASTSATLNSTVNANNDSTTVVFEYGTTTSFGNSINASQSPVTGTTTTAVSYTLTGLSTSTTYYARVKATNSQGTVYGETISFSTTIAGSGTSVDPYQVASLNDLKKISESSSLWGKSFIQTADIDASETSTWNSGKGFSPIGNASTQFTGTYNGEGHTITGLTISRDSTNYIGFFGYIASGATVDSLGLESSTVTGQNNVGALAGWNSGIVRSCYTTGVVTGLVTSIGGFIGQNGGGSVSYSHSSATANGSNDVGAFVGDNTNSGTISYCYATGHSNGGTSSSNYSSGGLVGYNESTISNCYATGNTAGYASVGGLVGSNYGTVNYSYAIGTVTGTTIIGGLTGYCKGTANYCFYNKEIFTGSANIGTGKTTVELQTLSTFTDAGWDFTGETANGTTNNWTILSSINSGYPFFLWQGTYVSVAPAVRTDSVSNVKATTAVASGAITTTGFPNSNHGFCYSISTSPTIADSMASNGAASDTGSFVVTITGLIPSTNYFLRAYAFNATDTVYGKEISFTTSTSSEPFATTFSVTNILGNTATFNGIINPNNAETTVEFEYGTTTSYGSSATAIQSPLNGFTTKTVTAFLTGLSTYTTYYVRVKATNSHGITYGESQTFTTLPFDHGTGSASDPYQISTLSDLKRLSATISLWGSQFIQTADIEASSTSSWNDGSGFSPIGTTDHYFTGGYNGNGHIIEGLTISRSTTTSVQGFFGYLSYATVSNLGISNATIYGGQVGCAGILAGAADHTTISKCFTSGKIYAYVCGGLMGGCYSSSISDCYTTGSVGGYGCSYAVLSGLIANGRENKISRCYSTAALDQGSSLVDAIQYYRNLDVFTNCFYNSEIASSASTATGKTTAEMKTQSTFTDAGWDFVGETANGTNDIWSISSTVNDGYPYLSYLSTIIKTWNGTTWDPSIPLSVNDAIINGDYDGDGFSCQNLTINKGYHVTFNTSAEIGGDLLIRNGATFISNIAPSLVGHVTVEQDITGAGGGTPNGRFWYVSSPVWDGTSSVFNAAGANKLWAYDESTHAYSEITDNTTELGRGDGYVVRVSADTTLNFYGGTLISGAVTKTLSRTGTTNKDRGYHLIGNPYTCFVDWDKIAGTNVSSSMWCRAANASNNMVFDSYNSSNQLGTSNSGTLLTQYIAPMQAFWVYVNADGAEGTVVFYNGAKSHQSGSSLRSAKNTDNQIIRLKVSNGSNSDEAILAFNANASDDFDGFDTQKKSNANATIPEIYTLAGDKQLVINEKSAVQQDQDITLGFRTGESNNFTIRASEISLLDTDLKLLLKDQISGTTVDITDGSAYSFASVITDTEERFSLVLSKTATGLENLTQSVSIFCNADNRIAVRLEGVDANEGTINVYSVLGQKIVSQKIEGETTCVNQKLTTGIYLVSVWVDGKETIQKVMLK